MWGFWSNLFDSSSFPPRWKCGEWSSGLGWLHIVSDLAIGSAYFVIPCLLGYYACRYKNFPFRGLVPFFVAFVMMCGLTHLMDATIFWWPAYRLSGLLKFCTAIISWASVFAIIRITPQFFGLRSASELEKEIAERRRVEKTLRELHGSLEQRVAERTAELEKSETQFRGVFDAAPIGMALVAPDGRFLRVNESFCGLLGYSTGELLATDFQSITHPADLSADLRQSTDLLAGHRTTYQIEKRYLHKDGREIPAMSSVSLVRDPAGKPLNFIKQVLDITERKRAEEALISSEQTAKQRAEELAVILDAVPAAVFIAHDPKCHHIAGNLAADELIRLPRGAEASLSASEETKPRHFKAIKDGCELRTEDLPSQRAAQGTPVENFEFTLVFDDGTYREMLAYATPLRDERGLSRGSINVMLDITERKIAAAALQESEERLRMAVEVAGLGVLQINYPTGSADLSPLAAELFDLPTGKPVTRKIIHDRFHPDDRAELDRRIAQCLDPSGDGWFALEHRIVRTDGSIRWLSGRKKVFFDVNTPQRAVLIVADITERKLAEINLRESEERLRLALEAGSMGTFEVDLQAGGCIWNDVEFRLLGLRPGEIEPTTDAFFRYVHPHDLNGLQSKWEIATRTGKFEAEFRIIRADGQLRWLAGAGTFLNGTSGKADGLPNLARFLGVNYDITERKQVEAALIASDQLARERAEELAATLDAVPTPIFISHDPKCQHMTGNRAANELIRLPRGAEASLSAPEETKPRHFKAVKDGRELRIDELPAQRAAQGIPVENFEFTLVFDDGNDREMLAYATPLRGEQGLPRGAINVLVDITERKVAEAALKARKAQLLSFVDQAPAAIAMFDQEMNCLAASQRWVNDYGRGQNIIGRNHYDVYHDLPERWKEIHRKALAGDPQSNDEDLWVQADGNQLWLRWAVRPWLDASGIIGGIIILSEDVTLRKQAENKIRTLNAELEDRVVRRTAQLQEVNNELESFSYSVSHDLRAPLRAINGFSRILIEDYGNQLPADAQDSLREICDNAEQMGRLIDHLLAFSRLGRQALKKSEVSMDAIVKECISSLSRNQSAEFRVAELPSAFADAALLKQVWQNLIENALKYSRSCTPPVVEIGAITSEQETVYFVKDNGVGFDMQYVHKLFKVFNRLHHQDEFEGTGVGLAIVQRVILRHGGRVWAEAKPKMGATFYFSLPIVRTIES